MKNISYYFDYTTKRMHKIFGEQYHMAVFAPFAVKDSDAEITEEMYGERWDRFVEFQLSSEIKRYDTESVIAYVILNLSAFWCVKDKYILSVYEYLSFLETACQRELSSGTKEYAESRNLLAFGISMSENLDMPVSKIYAVLLAKHLAGLHSYLFSDDLTGRRDSLEGRMADTINYVYLYRMALEYEQENEM